jgi:hypothetical protein
MILALFLLAAVVAIVYVVRGSHRARHAADKPVEILSFTDLADPTNRPVGPRHGRDGRP